MHPISYLRGVATGITIVVASSMFLAVRKTVKDPEFQDALANVGSKFMKAMDKDRG